MSMPLEEDAELRDLVAQTLESNGILGKIRAQLRASVFLALEEQESKVGSSPLVNTSLKDFLSTAEGRLMGCLVREFLEYFNLEFTMAVFDPETCQGQHYKYEGRQKLGNDLRVTGEATERGPLLAGIFNRAWAKDRPGGNGERQGSEFKVLDETMTIFQPQHGIGEDHSVSDKIEAEQLFEKWKTGGETESSDHDSFFDDPVPAENKILQSKEEKISAETKVGKYTIMDGSQIVQGNKASSSLTSLSDLPAIGQMRPSNLASLKNVPGYLPTNKGVQLAGLADDYEEDFHSSTSARSSRKSNADHSTDEDIDEDISALADELLNSTASGIDDITTDKTVSRISGTGVDYMESLG